MDEKKTLKTLANCNAVEFLKQTNKIKKCCEKYTSKTKIIEIIRRQPVITEKIEGEELKKMKKNQMTKNISDALEVALEKHPEETVEILGLMCFLTKEEALEMKGVELLMAGLELFTNDAVISFLYSMNSSVPNSSGNASAKST